MTDSERPRLRIVKGSASSAEPEASRPDSNVRALRRVSAPAGAPNSMLRQVDALLASTEAVRSMGALELHRLVDRIGLTDAVALLELAAPDQVRDLIDLEVWQGDALEPKTALQWLHALSQLPEPTFQRHIHALDIELLGFVIASKTHIYQMHDEDVPDDTEGPIVATPDGWYAIELLGADDAENEQLQALLAALYRSDADAARRLIGNLIAEMPAELEEWSRRWRNGRLQDLGFAEHAEALQVYTFLDPQSIQLDQELHDQPLRADPEPYRVSDLATIVPADDSSFWGRVVQKIEHPAERERLARALLTVCNLTLSADRIDPSDDESARISIDRVRSRLDLALEYLSRGQIETAPIVLSKMSLLRLVRIGHSLVLQRQRRLVPLLRAGALGRQPGGLDMLTHPLRDQLEALLATPPTHMPPTGAPRLFETLADLELADQRVNEAELLAVLVPRSSWPAQQPEPLTLTALFLTAVANRLLQRPEGALDSTALSALRATAKSDDGRSRMTEVAKNLAADRIGRTVDTSTDDIIRRWVIELGELLAALSDEAPDPQYIDLLQLSR